MTPDPSGMGRLTDRGTTRRRPTGEENLTSSGRATDNLQRQSCKGPWEETGGPPQMQDHSARDPQDSGTKDPEQKKVEIELTCQLVSPGRPVICMRLGVRLGWGWVRLGAG